MHKSIKIRLSEKSEYFIRHFTFYIKMSKYRICYKRCYKLLIFLNYIIFIFLHIEISKKINLYKKFTVPFEKMWRCF